MKPQPEYAHLDERTILADVGREFHHRGWSLGTSSNYSVVVDRDPLRLLITASGMDKGRLGPSDFLVVDEHGSPVTSDQRPSAETALHIVVAGRPGVGAVLHTHSRWATVLSSLAPAGGCVSLAGYEMLKGLAGITTHESTVRLRVYDNTQAIDRLAEDLAADLQDAAQELRYGFLMRGHGLYTWGRDVPEARRHVEVLEFLLEVVGLRRLLAGGNSGD